MFKEDRRDFIKKLGIAAVAVLGSGGVSVLAEDSSRFHIPMFKIPYALNALEPYISSKTIEKHYGTHHMIYFKRLNDYLEANPKYQEIPLEKLVKETKGGILTENAIFNFAVLFFNHNFYWNSMKPGGGILSEKTSDLTKNIINSFGSVDQFKEEFVKTSLKTGVGWTWLTKTNSAIKIIRTDYHDATLPPKYKPLVNIDLWEHAYYYDYVNKREEYVRNYLDYLINWEFAERNC